MKAFTRLYVLLVFLCVTSCRTQSWYTQQVAIGDYKYPGWLAGICAKEYPIIVDTNTEIHQQYIPASNIDYQSIIDSLYAVAANDLIPPAPNDTCIDKVIPYINKIKSLQQYILRLQAEYKKCVPDTVYLTKTVTLTQKNTAEIVAIQTKNDRNISLLNKWRNSAIIMSVLLLILSALLFIFKHKK